MSGKAPHPADDAARLEVGLLSLIFDLHPEHLTAAELVDRATPADSSLGDEGEAVRRAIRRLQQSELVSEENGVVVPTPAALHLDELPF
jgi:hypothetical protein